MKEIIGIIVAMLLACAFIGPIKPGYDVKLIGSTEESGDNGTLSFSTFWDENYKAISTSAKTLDGKARTETIAFDKKRKFAAGFSADADSYLSDVQSFTYVDGRYIGTIPTAHAEEENGISIRASAT